MRIRAIKIANTISFIFIFCSHIFLRILVPEFLKSCACLIKQQVRKHFDLKRKKKTGNCFFNTPNSSFVWDGEEGEDLTITLGRAINYHKKCFRNKIVVHMKKCSSTRPSNHTITNLVMKVLSLVNQKLYLFPPVQDLHQVSNMSI